MQLPWLVIGAESAIGGGMLIRLRQQGRCVIATTRRMRSSDNDSRFLNLADPLAFELPWTGPFVVLIAAGMSSLQYCHDNPEGTRAVNVLGVEWLCNWLRSLGGFPIVLSSNLVFDGQVAGLSETAVPNPLGEYGRQKRAAEVIALTQGSAAIIRVTKVFSPQTELWRSWHAALNSGQTITAFRDLRCAPLSLNDALSAIQTIGDRQASGIWHLSGTRDVSYVEIASAVLATWRFPQDRLIITTAAEHGILAAHRPRYTVLNTTRARQELNWEPQDVDILVNTLAHTFLVP